MNKFDFRNKTAVITGGAQGFGFDIAKKFLNFGAKVIIWDVNKKELKKAAQKINHSKLSFDIVDVSDFKKVKKATDWLYLPLFFCNGFSYCCIIIMDCHRNLIEEIF